MTITMAPITFLPFLHYFDTQYIQIFSVIYVAHSSADTS